MITHTTVTLTLDVNAEATAEELAAIRKFVDMEQNRIAADFAFVFSLTENQMDTTPVRMRVTKPKKSPTKQMITRIRRAYGL